MAKLLSNATAEWLQRQMAGNGDLRSRPTVSRWAESSPEWRPFELAIRNGGVYVRGAQSITIVGSENIDLRTTPGHTPAVPEWIQLSASLPASSTLYYLWVWLNPSNDYPCAWVSDTEPQNYTNADVKLACIQIGYFNPASAYRPAPVVGNTVLGNIYVPRPMRRLTVVTSVDFANENVTTEDIVFLGYVETAS